MRRIHIAPKKCSRLAYDYSLETSATLWLHSTRCYRENNRKGYGNSAVVRRTLEGQSSPAQTMAKGYSEKSSQKSP